MELWCPFAIKRISAMGLSAKNGYPGGIMGVPTDNLMSAPKHGEIKHDSTGPLSATFGVLDTHEINSWHFTIDEEIYQHYPVAANCWHGNDTDPDDDVRANVDLVGIEHTRINTAQLVPLAPRQVELTTKLTTWLSQNAGLSNYTRIHRGGKQTPDTWLLCEHNEVGNTPTACPSGRIPWQQIMGGLIVPGRKFAYGDEQNGLELRGLQQVTWIGGTEVIAVGDPEAVGLGRYAKLFGDTWWWLRKGPDGVPFWSTEEGD